MTLAEVISKYTEIGNDVLTQLEEILGIIAKSRIYVCLLVDSHTDEIMTDLGYELVSSEQRIARPIVNWSGYYSVELGNGISKDVGDSLVDVHIFKAEQ